MPTSGSTQTYPSHLPAKWTPVTFAASGDNTLVAAVAGQAIRVVGVVLSAASLVNIIFKDGANAFSGAMPITTLVLDLEFKPMICSTGNAFIANLSAAISVAGMLLVVQD